MLMAAPPYSTLRTRPDISRSPMVRGSRLNNLTALHPGFLPLASAFITIKTTTEATSSQQAK
jgi:hypothetical protein